MEQLRQQYVSNTPSGVFSLHRPCVRATDCGGARACKPLREVPSSKVSSQTHRVVCDPRHSTLPLPGNACARGLQYCTYSSHATLVWPTSALSTSCRQPEPDLEHTCECILWNHSSPAATQDANPRSTPKPSILIWNSETTKHWAQYQCFVFCGFSGFRFFW